MRELKRDELELFWTIDRRDVLHNIYVMRDGEMVLTPYYLSLHPTTLRPTARGEPAEHRHVILVCRIALVCQACGLPNPAEQRQIDTQRPSRLRRGLSIGHAIWKEMLLMIQQSGSLD